MENSAFLQSGLLLATICLFAYCLTLHKVGTFRSATAYLLTFSTFVSLVCVKWIPFAVYYVFAFTFFVLAVSGATVAYFNFLAPETDRAKTGAKLAYGLGAFLLFTIIIWTFDNQHAERAEKAIEHVSNKVDTIAVGQNQNKAKISKIETKLDTLAKNDTTLKKTVEATKSELWNKSDQSASEIKDGLSTLSLQQHRMNTNLQKQKQKPK